MTYYLALQFAKCHNALTGLRGLYKPRDRTASQLSRTLGRRWSNKASVLLTLFLPLGLFALAFIQQSAAHGSPQVVMVYKNSGARQCNTVDVTLEIMAKTLTANGIEVISSSCATDDLIRPAVCGFDAGLYYVYEIKARDMQRAGDLGFEDIRKFHGYKKRPCPGLNALP